MRLKTLTMDMASFHVDAQGGSILGTRARPPGGATRGREGDGAAARRAKDEEEFLIVCNELKRQIADQLETLGLGEAVQENDMKGDEEGAIGHDAGRTDAKAKEGGRGGG